MRKFFITIAIILGLLVIGIAVFVFTFDANQYKAALITKLEESMGKDVMIDNISLSLLHGLGIEIKGLAIKDKDKSWGNFLLKAKYLTINISVVPLLKKDVQIQRFLIPELEINTGFGANSPVFKSQVNLKASILINSLAQEDMLKTLSAKGKAMLTNAVLDNMNILKTVLGNLSILPGVIQKLKDNLPEKYRPLLDQNYTAFKPMTVDLEIKDGRIYFDKLLVESDAFYLDAKGSLGIIDQNLQISSNLFIPGDLSSAFIGIIPEFKYLINNNGQITMPLDIKGKIPNVSVMPNLDYVLKRLFATKGQELLNRLFKSK